MAIDYDIRGYNEIYNEIERVAHKVEGVDDSIVERISIFMDIDLELATVYYYIHEGVKHNFPVKRVTEMFEDYLVEEWTEETGFNTVNGNDVYICDFYFPGKWTESED